MGAMTLDISGLLAALALSSWPWRIKMGTSNQNEPGSTDPTLNNKTCSHLIHIISRHVSRMYCLSTYQSLEDMG
jgi:hypothetical protein